MAWRWTAPGRGSAAGRALAVGLSAVVLSLGGGCAPSDDASGESTPAEARQPDRILDGRRAAVPSSDGPVAGRSASADAAGALPAGTVLRLTLDESVSTATHGPGDVFRARVAQEVRDSVGRVVVPEGAWVSGMVTESRGGEGAGDDAVLGLALRSLEVRGRTLPLPATVQQARPTPPGEGADPTAAGRIAIGTAADALVGRAVAERGDDVAMLRSAVLARTGIALTARDDAVLPAGSRIRIQLTAPVRDLPRSD